MGRAIDDHGVIIVSGGMDSVTAAHLLRPNVEEMTILSIDYGQRHRKELAFAQMAAHDLGADWHRVDLTSITSIIGSSALTNPDIDVPEGHYAEETMRATVVPNRNAMMLDIATAVAVTRKAGWVATAVHSGDHAIYPDCRPEFVEAFEAMARVANEGFISRRFRVLAPFLYQSKADIARTGRHLGVDWTKTWSCYNGGDIHCGSCSTCFERREAFTLAGVTDPTPYLAEPVYSAPE